MTSASVDFDAPDLAARIERLSQSDLDQLPFGVILLDREGTVLIYSATEARLSGYGSSPLGQNFFAVSRCRNKDELRQRILGCIDSGGAELEFGWSGDYDEPKRDMRIRVQSSRTGGAWLFIERDEGRGGNGGCADRPAQPGSPN